MGANIITPTHLILVLVVMLLVFGPKKLPELGRGIGSAMKEFKGGINGEPAGELGEGRPADATSAPEERVPATRA